MTRPVLEAVVRATVAENHIGGYVPILAVEAYSDGGNVRDLVADLGGYHDYGMVTLIGTDKTAQVRFDGLIWFDGQGNYGYVEDTYRHVVRPLDRALRDNFKAVVCTA